MFVQARVFVQADAFVQASVFLTVNGKALAYHCQLPINYGPVMFYSTGPNTGNSIMIIQKFLTIILTTS